MTHRTSVTGFPRIGEKRELKKALELYWSNKSSVGELKDCAANLRKKHWLLQKEKGIDLISVNDFSMYDNMLDTIVMLNAVPERFQYIKDKDEQYFAMARGTAQSVAMEMSKWFNTNYHFILPELDDSVNFCLDASKILSEYNEAKQLGISAKINIIGPMTFLGLSKMKKGKDPYEYFDRVLFVYKQLFEEIAKLDDCIYVQMEEPVFVKDPTERQLELLKAAYQKLAAGHKNINIIVTTYFEHSNEATKALADIPVWGFALDFVNGIKNLQALDYIGSKKLIVGIVDGRSIWRNDFARTLQLLNTIEKVVSKEQIIVSTACSLLHVPYSTVHEVEGTVKPWLAFAHEKIEEVMVLSKLFNEGAVSESNKTLLEENKKLQESKSTSMSVHNSRVTERIKNIKKLSRDGNFEDRIILQKERLRLPDLPTTTIGSFPQTEELRKTRRDYKNGNISSREYETRIKKYIDECVEFQEEIGLDVLVHGEPERNDMVEYFGELLEGFYFTKNGWVQSYGSRCVKPPIIFGDVSRPAPMTVKWIRYAQDKTNKIMKGMLTGPVTILNWSFVRNDMPRDMVAKQIAAALSDEVRDLQEAGIRIIQVDEAAFREGYPLRQENIPGYEAWAVGAFRLAVSSANKETQIHTHMCYSDFNDIIKTLEAMDADVITIETARSGNKLLAVFKEAGYKNEIGPGVYDIHSPRIPEAEEFETQISARLEAVARGKMWVNPDCGLKTRKWEEVKPALKNMTVAVRAIRKKTR